MLPRKPSVVNVREELGYNFEKLPQGSLMASEEPIGFMTKTTSQFTPPVKFADQPIMIVTKHPLLSNAITNMERIDLSVFVTYRGRSKVSFAVQKYFEKTVFDNGDVWRIFKYPVVVQTFVLDEPEPYYPVVLIGYRSGLKGNNITFHFFLPRLAKLAGIEEFEVYGEYHMIKNKAFSSELLDKRVVLRMSKPPPPKKALKASQSAGDELGVTSTGKSQKRDARVEMESAGAEVRESDEMDHESYRPISPTYQTTDSGDVIITSNKEEEEEVKVTTKKRVVTDSESDAFDIDDELRRQIKEMKVKVREMDALKAELELQKAEKEALRGEFMDIIRTEMKKKETRASVVQTDGKKWTNGNDPAYLLSRETHYGSDSE